MKNIFKKIIVWIITWEARIVLRKYKPKIVAITGSVGKTSTKNAIYTVLSNFFYTRKSQKSFNSEIGVPLTILDCPNGWSNPFIWFKNILKGLAIIICPNHYPRWLVLEVGADRPGDIKKISKWLKPDVSVFTRFSKVPVHVEFFDSPKEVIKEKSYLLKNLRQDGILVLNADDEDVYKLKKDKSNCKSISFGLSDSSVVRATHSSILYKSDKPAGINFRIDYDGNSIPVVIPGVLGEQHIYPVLAACAVGVSLNLNIVKIAQVWKHYDLEPGRMRLIEGIKHINIIDDTYNSSPVAVDKALDVLGQIKTDGRKIAVLGDMLELGDYSEDEHKKAGKKVSSVSDTLITVGDKAQDFYEGAKEAHMSEKNVFKFKNSIEAQEKLQQIIQTGDTVLVKGSQGARMEKIVEEIIAHPEHKDKLLVRQENVWKNK